MNRSITRALLVLALVGLAAVAPDEVWAQRRGGGRNSGRAAKQVMINEANMALAYNRQVLAEAETVINDASSTVSESQSRLEGARKSVTDAKSTAHDSAKSQRTIEAEILAAQGEGSEYFKANVAMNEAKEAMNESKERVLSSDAYLKKKAELAKESDSGPKIAKMRDTFLEQDDEYMSAMDKHKAAAIVFKRVKENLFKSNADWVAASKAAHDAHSDEIKANSEASRGAMKKMPAMRNLREAQEVADEARANIAAAETVLKSLNAPIPKPGMGDASYSSASAGK